jgi:hypothetical protein
MKLTGVEGVGAMNRFKLLGFVRVHWSAFGIGDIPGDPTIKRFTLGDIELLGVKGVGGDPAMKGLKLLTVGIRDILGDPSVKRFTLGGIKLLVVEGVGDWGSETVGDILWDP